jgi:F0F1-type ATP synthase delta subunit
MRSTQVLLAQKYAQAYLTCFSAELNTTDLINLHKLQQFISAQKNLYQLANFLGAKLAQQNNFTQALVTRFDLPVSFTKLLDLLVQHRVVLLLAKILDEIIINYQILTKNYIFVIKSVAELSLQQLELIKAYLTNSVSQLLEYPATVVCELQLDTSLVAGVQAINQLFFWDGSVLGRVQKLESALRLS